MTPIEIYADGPTIEEMESFDQDIIKGYTFNPTLFRNLGVEDYLGHCRKVVVASKDLPVSLEVIADSQDEMIRQAHLLSALGDNVFVKIPITYTSGESTSTVLKTLIWNGVNINITAVFDEKQLLDITPYLEGSNTIISVFSGRIFDIGLDAVESTREIAELVHVWDNWGDCKVLWASPRMVYDINNAIDANCDIITMQPSLIKKLSLFGITPEEYSLDTVQMFYNDAVSSGYTL